MLLDPASQILISSAAIVTATTVLKSSRGCQIEHALTAFKGKNNNVTAAIITVPGTAPTTARR